jgi:hypothetical protein
LDGSKLRQDLLVAESAKEIKCRNCEKEGQFVHFLKTETTKGPVYMEYGSMPGDGRQGDPNYRNLFFIDPRVFGLRASRAGQMHAHQLDAILGKTDRTPPSLEKTKWNGNEAYIVRFTATSGPKAKFAYWIVPEMDHSVVRCEHEGQDDAGKKYLASLKCEIEKYGKPGIWFPKAYVAEGTSGEKSLWRETMHLTDVKINEDLPPDTFKLIGMNIPVGWPIYGTAVPDKNKKYKWDGSKMIESTPPNAKDQPKQTASAPLEEGSAKTILLTAAAALAVSGTVALGLYFRNR